MKVQVLDIKGNKLEDLNLNEKVFGIVPNNHVMGLYLRVFAFNQRQGNSKVKTRGEVSGSGKKPWAQKGTGRARVGQKRSPLWRHGGIIHGPSPKDWTLSLPKKVKKLALLSALSFKFSKENALVVDSFAIDKPKTKEIVDIAKNLKLRGKSLLVLDTVDEALIKSAANVKDISTAFVENLNTFEVLKNNKVVFTKNAIKKLEEKYQ